MDHKCREKGLETNCPICCDFLFTSSETVRGLPCGHFMHSACFQVSSLLFCWAILVPLLSERILCCLLEILFELKAISLFPQAYACTHYICPICSKSMGDMSVRDVLPSLNKPFSSVVLLICINQ